MSSDGRKKSKRTPPEGRRWQKGVSGNLRGRPVKVPPTWAEVIEGEWKKSIKLANGQRKTALELILLHAMHGVRMGDRRAFRIKQKFEEIFRKKLLAAYEKDYLDERSDGESGRHRVHIPEPDAPLSEKERKYRAWQEAVESILPAGIPLNLLPHQEALKLYRLLQKAPERPMSRDRWHKPKSGNLHDTEIFELVLNSPVALEKGGRKRRVARMAGTIEALIADAAKGKLKSAEMLLDLYRKSVKDGDFGTPKRGSR